jgi:integrase
MSHSDIVTAPSLQPSLPEMMRDHRRILENYFDTFITRGLSPKTRDNACGFIRRWFENIKVSEPAGERQVFIWEVMNLGEGRERIKKFLMMLSAVEDDNKVCLRPQTARTYAGYLERLFIGTLRFPFIEELQTISSKYGPIENPFTGVEYPIHSRDNLRSERFFLTPKQILALLIFLREVYPGLTHKNLTAARLYATVILITETGMRSNEVINLDALGDERDIFYKKKRIQTRHGKGHNSSGPQTRSMTLTRPAEITLMEYERNVRPQFKNQLTNPALFLTEKGKRLSYFTLRDCFTRLVESARKHGVDLPANLTIHDLRASFATNYIEANPDQFCELMEALGHASPSSTLLYIRSKGKNKWLSMKEARGPRGRRGFGQMVYNT